MNCAYFSSLALICLWTTFESSERGPSWLVVTVQFSQLTCSKFPSCSLSLVTYRSTYNAVVNLAHYLEVLIGHWPWKKMRLSDFDVNGHAETTSQSITGVSLGTNLGADLPRPSSASGWINTVPLSASTNTLSKRSARTKRQPNTGDLFVKDYIKKRNLILDLLVGNFH